ncbi:unnamed protein product [Rotaria sp. Silwood2]|nr:unnamed protein product [Rotaria sp. Silwood2]CAF3005181.1 unnamed protein product [Rotaria sp. Silwood2]CAF4049354.1 unnamed protein product [Rotaria sp. Silwood2]CAF4117190.1 unnamed protein product [Rotaria sp. Silwood2]
MHRFTDVEIPAKRLPHIFGYLEGPLLGLMETLEPLSSHVKYLHEAVKTATKKCHFPSEHGLTRDESAALYIYTMEWDEKSLYKVLNEALRSKYRKRVTVWFPYLKLFHTAVQKLPNVQKNLWRGIERDFTNSFKKDDVITWWSISSCSPDVDVIKEFLKDNSTLFLIEAVQGKDISMYSSYPFEKEVLLCPATRLQVLSNGLESSSFHLVHLREMHDESLPSPPPSATLTPATIDLTFGVLVDEIGNRYESSIHKLYY